MCGAAAHSTVTQSAASGLTPCTLQDIDEDGQIDNWGSSAEPCYWDMELNLFGASAVFDASFYGVRKQ